MSSTASAVILHIVITGIQAFGLCIDHDYCIIVQNGNEFKCKLLKCKFKMENCFHTNWTQDPTTNSAENTCLIGRKLKSKSLISVSASTVSAFETLFSSNNEFSKQALAGSSRIMFSTSFLPMSI